MEIRKLTLNDPTYPAVLRGIPTPPQQIYVRGELEPLLARPRLAIVGSRKVTPYGKHITTKLASEVAQYGVVIVSGLALGVDGIAHQAALDVGGLTIAILGGGLDRITPVTNASIAERLLQHEGALVSEYAVGRKPYRYSFVARNRLIAGLCDVLLVTEAALDSGSRHTVEFALDQGKTVMAVPGNIDSPLSGGTNQLIKTGASLVTGANDILHEFGLDYSRPVQTELFGGSEAETTLLRLLQAGETESSKLLTQSGLSVPEFNQALTMLEITDRIYSLGAAHWKLR